MHTGSTAGGACGAISILLALERLLITNHQSNNSPSDLAPSHAGAIPNDMREQRRRQSQYLIDKTSSTRSRRGLDIKQTGNSGLRSGHYGAMSACRPFFAKQE